MSGLYIYIYYIICVCKRNQYHYHFDRSVYFGEPLTIPREKFEKNLSVQHFVLAVFRNEASTPDKAHASWGLKWAECHVAIWAPLSAECHDIGRANVPMTQRLGLKIVKGTQQLPPATAATVATGKVAMATRSLTMSDWLKLNWDILRCRHDDSTSSLQDPSRSIHKATAYGSVLDQFGYARDCASSNGGQNSFA